MIATLAVNETISAGTTYTYSYSPKSLNEVHIVFNDDSDSNHWLDAKITVQIGSRTICNGAMAVGLSGLQKLESGYDATGIDGLVVLDYGNITCVNNENVYISIQGGANEIHASDVSLVVDEIRPEANVQYVEYSDTVFTAPKVLVALGFDNTMSGLEGDTGSVNVQTNSYGMNARIPSLVTNMFSKAKSSSHLNDYALICTNEVPMDSSFNYSASVMDRIITVQACSPSASAVRKNTKENAVAIAGARISR